MMSDHRPRRVERFQLGERLKIVSQRVGAAVGVQADIRADARQNGVSGDQQPRFCLPQPKVPVGVPRQPQDLPGMARQLPDGRPRAERSARAGRAGCARGCGATRRRGPPYASGGTPCSRKCRAWPGSHSSQRCQYCSPRAMSISSMYTCGAAPCLDHARQPVMIGMVVRDDDPLHVLPAQLQHTQRSSSMAARASGVSSAVSIKRDRRGGVDQNGYDSPSGRESAPGARTGVPSTCVSLGAASVRTSCHRMLRCCEVMAERSISLYRVQKESGHVCKSVAREWGRRLVWVVVRQTSGFRPLRRGRHLVAPSPGCFAASLSHKGRGKTRYSHMC